VLRWTLRDSVSNVTSSKSVFIWSRCGGILFSQTCVACHGSDGTGGVHGAPRTTTTLSLAELTATIGNGREQMSAFGRAMKPEDLHDVAAFTLDRLVARSDAQ
jgi:mono/diheme cytochrome c family protein